LRLHLLPWSVAFGIAPIVCLNVPMSVTGGWKASWVIPDVYTVLRGCRLYPDSHLGHSIMCVVVFMAAQPSKDGRLGGSPQTLMRVGIPQKGSSKASAAFYQCSILPKVGELMVSSQQYDSHEAECFIVDRECFIVDRSTPYFRAWG
jgi:hypothetical protein